MKKKLLGVIASTVMLMSTALGIAACDEEGGGYTVSVKSNGGAPITGVQVQMYDGDSLLATKTTDKTGEVTFELEGSGYDVKLVNLPQGLSEVDGASYKANSPDEKINVVLNTEVIKSSAPAGKTYQIGDIMYDFTVTNAINEESLNLSTLLEDKKAVVLNFWAEWCGPCKAEFPFLEEAYTVYEEKLEVLAINTSDDLFTIRNFAASNNYSFPMIQDTAGIKSFFPSDGIPYTIVVDRYGVVAATHLGSAELETFMSLFNKYTSDSYVPSYVVGGGVVNNDTETEIEILEPNVSMPSSSAIEAAVNAPDSNITYSARREGEPEENYQYTWPWLIKDDTIYPASKDLHNAHSIIFMEFEAYAGDTLAFDYKLDTERGYDVLYVQVSDGAAYNNTIIHELSGENDWKTLYVFNATRRATYTVSLTYLRDSDDHDDPTPTESTVAVKNVRLVNVSQIDSPTTIKHYAVDGFAASSSEKTYSTYANVVYNSEDKYYHVGTANGPILYADLMNATPWSSASVYSYVYYDMCVFEGFDFSTIYDEYCWIASNSDNGYCPVNEDLAFLLQMLIDNYGKGYDFEWLEFCLYYQRFNMTEPEVDPVRGVWFTSAIEVTEGQTEVVIEKVLVPRGYKYAFTPTRSGAYKIQSLGNEDTYAWIFNSDRQEIAASDGALTGNTGRNFYFNQYLEAGKTYYILCAFWKVDQLGSYTLDISYIAESYDFFTNAAIGPYTYDEVTGEIYVPDSIETVLGSDGFYHELREDGTKGSKIYLDMVNYTYLLSEQTMQQIIESADNYEFNKQAFYFSGMNPDGTIWEENYTATMQEYLDEALSVHFTDPLYGYVAVDAQLYDILKLFTKKYDGFGGVRNSWLMLCYYYQHLGA